MIRCRLARTWIERAADGELEIEQELRLEQHLAHCARCRGSYERHQQLEELFAGRPEPAYERLDVERAVANVRAAVEAGTGGGAGQVHYFRA